MRTGLGMTATLLVLMVACPAQAQLIRDEVRGDQRICTYYGSEQLPNDTVEASTVTTGIGQNCPATAPYRDPDARPPDNAALRGETTSATNRICTYEQGGIEYLLAVALTVRCAQTPALLEREANR